MSYSIYTLALFDEQAKRLAKKYPSLKDDLAELIQQLIAFPKTGKPLGNNFYKIRLAITSKNAGKSGGTRVITYVKVVQEEVFLTSIYDKSAKATITSKELELIFKSLP